MHAMDLNLRQFYIISLLSLLLMNVYVGEGFNNEVANEYGLSFFTPNELKLGNVMPLVTQIFVKNPKNSVQFLPKNEADVIPFSLSRLPYLLDLFGFSPNSPDAKNMKDTLTNCETVPVHGETKFCAISLESLLDHVKQNFGSDTHFKAISSKPVQLSKNYNNNYVENYTIVEEPTRVASPIAVPCHIASYPYVIYQCHRMDNAEIAIKVFQVLLRGENNGVILEAISVCHMDTSQWGPEHNAFSVFGVEFGSPVCHFFPYYDLVFVPTLSTTSI